MAKTAKDWRWSRYRATAGFASAVDWLQTDKVPGLIGSDRPLSQRQYRKFMKKLPGEAKSLLGVSDKARESPYLGV
jgi:REP-associated tyrosine transposase